MFYCGSHFFASNIKMREFLNKSIYRSTSLKKEFTRVFNGGNILRAFNANVFSGFNSYSKNVVLSSPVFRYYTEYSFSFQTTCQHVLTALLTPQYNM